MGCQYFAPTEQGADSFTVAMPRLSFGRGILREVGERASALALSRVALFTDPALLPGPLVTTVTNALKEAGIDVGIFSDIRVEPDDESVRRGHAFLSGSRFDGVVSVGGGSVMDTAKAALVLQAHGGEVQDYFAPPVGRGKPITGPLLPHIACPTTSGTGSECTSISVLRINSLNTKFVIASPCMLPVAAVVDPQCCDSLPANVVASTGFDLCCHALECYTARAYTRHHKVDSANARQYIQGANPFSDMAAREAMSIVGRYLERGVNDASDHEARDQLMWGATLAGIAFGNAGTHLPHAMSYGVTHLMSDITTEGYAVSSPFIPHGISVIVNAPAIFRYTAEATPERHLEGASCLLADTRGAMTENAG
ncbi:MAG: iron-containing alcohol dehydrogenase, partial [Granulosicoccus sp.]|nr:iron-containing alcohol dehydrogenase [Granulosicoccus sp.]